MSRQTVALIDLAPLTRPGGIDAIAAELARALEEVGFFIVTNHGVAQTLIDEAFAQAKRFHAQPLEAKHALLMNEHNNGYMAMARYNVRTSRVSEAAKPDMNEAFFCKRERDPDDPLVRAQRRFAGPNRWPVNLPGFKTTVLEFADAVDALGRRLLAPLARALGMPADTFDEAFASSQFSLRLSHYPPVERTPGQYGIAPHTDMNFLTLLAQSDVPGLQIRDGEEGWHDVPLVPGSFVVNAGDTLHRFSNERFKSTPHRALPPHGRSRYAVPFFLGPHLDTVVHCLASCCSAERPARYEPVTYGDFMDWWYDANYNARDQADLAEGSA